MTDMTELGEREQIEVIDLELLVNGERRVMVMIQHPGMPTAFESVYGCRFDVAVGDAVICPPAPLWPEPFTGIVTSLSDAGVYHGPIKYLLRKAS